MDLVYCGGNSSLKTWAAPEDLGKTGLYALKRDPENTHMFCPVCRRPIAAYLESEWPQANRVAIKVADEVIDRATEGKRRGYGLQSDSKKPEEKDVNSAHARMLRAFEMQASSAAMSMGEVGNSLLARQQVARRMNEVGILSGNSGVVAVQVPDIRELLDEADTGFDDIKAEEEESLASLEEGQRL